MAPAQDPATVLVIDDERDLVELVRWNLEKEGFRVVGAPDGETGFALALQRAPDLILLDRMMPGADGVEICRRLRRERKTADVPVILLTAKAAEADRVAGLEAGADDYVTKPFSPRELLARVRARLRRKPADLPSVVRNGDLVVDEDRGEVTWGGRALSLSPAERRVLQLLAGVPGKVLFRRSAEPGGQLLGALARRQRLVAAEPVQEALALQDRNPSRRLGEILVERCLLSKSDLDSLLARQSQAAGAEGDAGGSLLGRLLIAKGLATEYPVNDALKFQGRLVEAGVRPVPRLGEILLKRGVIGRAGLAAALQLQSFMLYRCPDCGARTGLRPGTAPLACPDCRAEIPALFVRMAAALDGVLDETLRSSAVALPDEVAAAAADPKARFGRYLRVGELGRGGSGVVHRAWDLERNRFVALKVLLRGTASRPDPSAPPLTPFGDAESVKRFLVEARAVAELDHPNIVPLLDYGTAEGALYYAMPVVDGVSLERRIQEAAERGERPPLRFSLATVRALALALDAAHRRGICHRDVKPGNVLIDRSDRPWLIDFGVARIARLGDSAWSEGVIVGTPYYMPPEQTAGDMEKVDARSDLYSLGAVLYELVSGRPPYAELSPDAVPSVRAARPPAPIGAVAPAAPAPVRALVERAMETRPERRFGTAALFAAAAGAAESELPPEAA